MSAVDKEELEVLINYDHSLVLTEYEKSNKQSEEVRAFVLGEIALKICHPAPDSKVTEESKKFLKTAEGLLTRPSRLLRFLSVLEGEEPEADKKIYLKFRKGYAKFIIRVLSGFDLKSSTVCEELSAHERIFKILFKGIHAGSFKKNKKAQDVIKAVRTGKYPTLSKLGLLELFCKKYDRKCWNFLLTNPGLFFRNAIRFCSIFPIDIEHHFNIWIILNNITKI